MLQNRKSLMQRFLTCILFWNPILSCFFTLFFNGFDQFLPRFLISMIISSTTSTVCFGAVAAIRRMEALLYSRLGRAIPRHTGPWYVFLSCLFMPLGLYLGFHVAGIYSARIGHPWSPPDLNDYRIGILWGVGIAVLFLLWESRRDAREAQQATELKLRVTENERLQAQISALTAQMNPHLLFNALNTVASLVPSDPELAEVTILHLAELYRGVLTSSQKQIHSLATELELCRAYLGVEKARFGAKLDVSFKLDPHLQAEHAFIPALSLQPLVENAIRHGLGSKATGGKVQIEVRLHDDSTDAIEVLITDDGVGFGNSMKRGTGTGLSNCRERLRLAYGCAARIDIELHPGGGTQVRVRIPQRMARSAELQA